MNWTELTSSEGIKPIVKREIKIVRGCLATRIVIASEAWQSQEIASALRASQ